MRYPLYAAQVAGAVSNGTATRGILICSTGIGMSIIANKFKGVRASLCTSVHMGRMTRAHNDSNLLCLGGKITMPADILAIVDAWIAPPFEGGRHCISLDLIKRLRKFSPCGRPGPRPRVSARPSAQRGRGCRSSEWPHWPAKAAKRHHIAAGSV